ncbi:g2552 [Coccomyxa elongata]
MRTCEMLENTDPACITDDFCARVFVPPCNNPYLVRLLVSQRPKRYNSHSRPVGGRAARLKETGEACGRVAKLMKAGKRKRVQKNAAGNSKV